MAAGLGRLGLSPVEFWAATPRELAAAFRGRLGIEAAVAPLARGELEGLMSRFPDKVAAKKEA